MPERDRTLPGGVVVGDHVRVKEDRKYEIARACELAGYRVDLDAIRVVVRDEGKSSHRRLAVEGAPHYFWPDDVALAWNTDAERRAGLELAGSIRPLRVTGT